MIRAYDEYGNIVEDYEKQIYNKAVDKTISRLKQVTNKDIVVITKDNLDNIARELKEQDNENTGTDKQIPKKPIFQFNLSDNTTIFNCQCGVKIKVHHDIGIMDNNDAPNYCKNCGQKFDWSE